MYGPRALPVIADTVSDNCTFGNGALVLSTLAELENPIRVATMTMLLWPDTTLTQRPHQLRMGDAVEIDVAGFADFHAVVAGLAWRLSADNIPEIEVVALETPPPPPPPPLRIVNTNVTLDVDRMATLTWTGLGVSLVEHEIRWNIDGGDFVFIDMVSPTVTSHTFLVASISNGEILGVQIRGVNDTADGEWSHIATVTASGLPALPVHGTRQSGSCCYGYRVLAVVGRGHRNRFRAVPGQSQIEQYGCVDGVHDHKPVGDVPPSRVGGGHVER